MRRVSAGPRRQALGFVFLVFGVPAPIAGSEEQTIDCPTASLTRLFLLAALAHGEVSAKSIGVEAWSSKKTILSHHERPAYPLFCFWP